MRPTRVAMLALLLAAGCQDKKVDSSAPPPSGVAGPSRSADTRPQPPVSPAAQGAVGDPKSPVAGSIKGKPFAPDKVVLEGTNLQFRQGKDVFAEMEIAFELPKTEGEKLDGKEFRFGGDNFGDPMLRVSARDGGPLPKTDIVFAKDYRMTLRITKRTAKGIEGAIDLRVSNPANTHLVGQFAANVKKTGREPLSVDDAPYIQGRVVLSGDWKEESLLAGFFAKGTDGKSYSNAAGTKFKPHAGGWVTSTTFDPQLTSLFEDDKNELSYRHTHLAPGEYLVYVSRNDIMAAWKKVTVKAGDQQAVDLTIDLAKTGSLVVTLPDEEANDPFEARLQVFPDGLELPTGGRPYSFGAAAVKKGQKTVTLKDVPAGKYHVVRGKSEGHVEVAAGKEASVSLVRKPTKR